MANKKIPVRVCVGCSQSRSKKELIRIIKTPNEEIIIDATGRKNGRGAYICPDPECFKKARKSKGLERSLKSPIPEDVYENLEREMHTLEK